MLRFAAVYGFRNIQTLVRKIKMKRCEYDYVEVMACPSGARPLLFCVLSCQKCRLPASEVQITCSRWLFLPAFPSDLPKCKQQRACLHC